MTDILDDFVRNNFRRLIIVSGHAGSSHMTAIKLAAKHVVNEHVDEKNKARIMVCSDYDFAFDIKDKDIDERDSHAGTVETSRVMAIRRDLVKGNGLKNFPDMPRFEITPNPERYFPSGVMGDPTKASLEKGQKINIHIIEQIAKLVEILKQ